MGLITGILTFPLAPVRGVAWLAEQILSQAENELYDPAAIRAALNEVEMQRELGMVTEEDAERMEEALLARLLASRDRPQGTDSGEETYG